MDKRRILFVDDEQKILDGLQRMLRGLRHEWEMTFMEDPVQAAELIRNTPFDVVVTDMRMPRMDGAELLTIVKEQCPDAVRIILSGYAEKDLIMKSFRVTHQYLVKPTDAETLKNVISRACALRDLLTSRPLKHLVSRMDSIPSIPVAYARIMELLHQQDVSVNEVSQVIEEDLGMTAKILQLVNSAFFGLPQHFTDISQAVVYLGFETVKTLALTCEIFSRFDPRNPSGFNIEGLFAHSRAVSILSRKIAGAENLAKEKIDNAFMAGLLHDVGKLVIAGNFPERYREISAAAAAEPCAFHEAEQKILGATHAEVGAYLMGLWGLPGSIVEAIAFHHRPDRFHEEVLEPAGVVHAADVLCHLIEKEDSPTSDSVLWDMDYIGRLGLAGRIPVWRKLAMHEQVDPDGNPAGRNEEQ